MGDEKTLYESESRRTITEVVDFLKQLAQWLENREIGFETEGETWMMAIPEEVELEIEIEEEDEGGQQMKRTLEIEISWREAKTVGVEEEE